MVGEVDYHTGGGDLEPVRKDGARRRQGLRGINLAKRARILVVEDEPEISGFVQRYLEQDGYLVTPVRDGESALMAERQGADLVVLDLMLPGINGLEVIRRLRAGDNPVPILITYISRTTQWLLDLARWEGGEPLLRRETFPVLEVVMEVAETLEEAARAARVSLLFDGLDPGWRVHADRARCREIFQILLENGVQHAGPDTTLRLTMRPHEERLQIQVCDDGAGFSQTAHSRAFGQSLGLKIAERLVAAHGGKLKVESQPGQGTRIGCSLPAGIL